jgi:predicted dehydrogenase
MPLRFAIAGAGYIADVHARAVHSLPDAELVALQHYNPDKVRPFVAKHDIPKVYATVEELAAAGGVDALIVATPNALHASQTITALQAGIHVIVEKPMAMNAQEAECMIAAGRKSGALLMVAHCWRFDPEVQWLRQQVEARQLGKIIRTKGYGVHVNWGPSGWFTQKAQAGGGALADMGIHGIDTACFLLGSPQPASVYARIGAYYTSHDVDDTGLIMIAWESGATSYIESGWWQPYADGPEACTQIYGTKGFGRLFPTHLIVDGVKRDPGFPAERVEHCPQSMYDDQMAYFARCIRAGETPSPGGSEGLVNMRIVDAAYESSRIGKVVDL